MTLTVDTRRAVGRTARRHDVLRFLPLTATAVDLGVIFLTCGAAVLGHGVLGFEPSPEVADSLYVVGPVIAVGWLFSLLIVGAYADEIFGAGPDEFKRIVTSSAMTAAVVGIVCYLGKFQLSRGFFVLAFCIGTPALILGRYALRKVVHRARERGSLQQTVLISGTAEHVDEIAAVLRRERWLGYTVLGALTPSSQSGDFTPGGVPVVGASEHVRGTARELHPDVIFFADNALGSGADLREVVWDLEERHTQVVVAPSVADISNERVRIRPVGGLPLIHIEKPRALAASRRAKRIFDVVGSLGLLLAFAPIFAFAAGRVYLHDRGPILYRHTRVGRNGQAFGCFKFRTMVQHADLLQTELMMAAGADQLLFKLKDDPRVTRPGRWLRKYSFDELPQLLNVLRGEMSLVGPRPQVADEVATYDDSMSRRLLVRPGMTGLWQVSGRSDLSVDEARRLDLYYVDNWSMLQDLSILMRTLRAVTRGSGAY